MANLKSAKKAHLQSEKRRIANAARRSALKTAIKKFNAAIAEKVSAKSLEEQLRVLAAQLARARGKGVVKKNTASRTLSRLTVRANQATKR